MKLAICNETYRDWPWDQAMEHAVRHGFTGWEVAPFTLGPECLSQSQVSNSKVRELKSLCAQTGLEIVGLHWLLAFTQGYHLTSEDTEVRQRTTQYLVRLSDLCAELGGGVMVFGSPAQRELQATQSFEDGLAAARSVVEPALPVLEKNQTILAIEPLGSQETNFLNTAAEGVQFCELFDSPWVQLHLDVKAMSSEQRPIPEIIKKSRDWLVHFHANDPNLRGPGMGEVGYEPIFQALAEINYRKWISVEVFDQECSVELLVEESAAYLQSFQ